MAQGVSTQIYFQPNGYRQRGHEAIGMDQLTDADLRRVKAYYYAEISLIDDMVGRLLAQLKCQGMAD